MAAGEMIRPDDPRYEEAKAGAQEAASAFIQAAKQTLSHLDREAIVNGLLNAAVNFAHGSGVSREAMESAFGYFHAAAAAHWEHLDRIAAEDALAAAGCRGSA